MVDPYELRSPVAPSIYPHLTIPNETLSLLHEINASRPLSKRLPIELLLHINKELHRPNPLWEDIRAAWKPMAERYELDWRHANLFEFQEEALFYHARFDQETKRFYIPENISTGNPAVDVWKFRRPPIEYLTQMTSADLLYRSLCYFPEIYINTEDGGKWVWAVKIQHKQTGLMVLLMDHKGGPLLSAFYNKDIHSGLSETESRITLLKAFSIDLVRLLNAFFGTIDGSRRFEYYHPAADADSPTRDEHYVAVPAEWERHRIVGMEEDYVDMAFRKWHFRKVSTTDLSSFRSLLQTLKYDIQSRIIDPVNGTANLTTVISSALLFYRLICKYTTRRLENVNLTPPITSVWQIQLTHRKTGASIIFMDDHGLFDIRGSEDTKEVMSDVEALVESLCSDSCTHPYDGVVAGCIA